MLSTDYPLVRNCGLFWFLRIGVFSPSDGDGQMVGSPIATFEVLLAAILEVLELSSESALTEVTLTGEKSGFTMISKFLGPRYQQLAKNWIPVLATWGTVGGVGLVWATDWRLILDYVPYINGKFKTD